MQRERLLIVDDSEEIRNQLAWGLGKEYALLLAGTSQEALLLFQKHRPRVVLLDLMLSAHEQGNGEGFQCLENMLRESSQTKVIVITGSEDRMNALKAIEMGAYDFYRKPIALRELRVIIQRAYHLFRIEEEGRQVRQDLDRFLPDHYGMVGQCSEMVDVFGTIKKAAASDVTVLIQGESGTGKELVARAIHGMSRRKDGPFVPIHCGAIPDSLLESELFGHEKGAFTGAHAQVLGKVEYANQGTLFLDEIGEISGHLQVKLLRFLQDRRIQRVGGREDIAVDLRIVAATNRDLAKDMRESRFREDLYYRLGVVVIPLPPLRERKSDIVRLAMYFLAKYADQYGRRIRGFSAPAFEQLEGHSWPGNVREMENKIQRAVILSEGTLIEAHDLGFRGDELLQRSREAGRATLREAKDKVERDMVMSAIDKHRGNIARAAEELGISRPTLYDAMKKHGLFSLHKTG